MGQVREAKLESIAKVAILWRPERSLAEASLTTRPMKIIENRPSQTSCTPLRPAWEKSLHDDDFSGVESEAEGGGRLYHPLSPYQSLFDV